MATTYTTADGRLITSIPGEQPKEVFAGIAKFQEVFESEPCGKCGSEEIRYVVRNIDDNDYYEKRCKSCGAKLQFGAHKVGGGLFPKRKDGSDWLPDNGWVKWNPKTEKNE